jgi:predicted SnoaL-like aldol condensation-catalyzing enzyme
VPTSARHLHIPTARALRRTLGGLAVAALAVAGCGGDPSAAPPAGSQAATTETTSPTDAARELVGRQLDTMVGADTYQLLIVVAEGPDVAAVHRALDGPEPYEALTTWRLDGGQLTGATTYRSTQKLGTGPTTSVFLSNAAIDQATTEANRKRVVTMYHDVIDLRQPDAPARHIAEGYIQHNPMVPQGRAGIEGFIQRMGPAAPGTSTRKDELVVADGELVLLVSEFGGRRIADLFRVEEGLVAEHWDFTPAAVP